MLRITKKLFTDLAIWMGSLGFVIGFLFPPFTVILGFDPERAYSVTFWIICVLAGILVAFFNYWLANKIVRKRLKQLALHMRKVEQAIDNAVHNGDWSECSPEECNFIIDSEDELGDCAKSFNDLVGALFRSHEVEGAVTDLTKALSSQLDLDLLSRKALELLLHHTGAVAGMVITSNSGGEVISANHGIRNPEKIMGSHHVRLAFTKREIISVKIPQDVHIEAVLADFRPTEVLVIPVVFKDAVLGAVILATAEHFTSDTRWVIQFFRQGFGLALNNAVIHGQMQQMAALDALTGALDRRFGVSRLQDEFARSRRTEAPLAVLMLDLDFFKQVNDVYGHLTGDRALVETVKVIRRVLRESDVVVRYGGEEFLLVIPGANRETARMTAERIRESIEGLSLTEGGRVVALTASIGVTSYPEDCSAEVNDLVRSADQALYHAKEHGRNQVVVFSATCIK
ncbi:MAG: GGDEF domain-containing protein [Gammaproteobacteria bacterium]|nr:GGDEF domain-containing protein [Gammaproteobacteria bacterium]